MNLESNELYNMIFKNHPVLFTTLICFVLGGEIPAVDEPSQAEGDPTVVGGDAWQLPVDKEDFHIFLLMGQSNMTGKGGPEPGDEKPVSNVLFIPHELQEAQPHWTPGAHPLHTRKGTQGLFGPGLSFAKEYLKKHPGVTVGLIPAAKGGARIEVLNKGTSVYGTAMEKAAFAAKQGTIKGILWQQGESDSTKEERANAYEDNLHTLISDVRSDLNIENLPFIVCDLGEFYGRGKQRKNIKHIEKVRSVLKSLPEKVEDTACVQTTGLKHRGDRVHFSREAYIELGKRHAESYEKLIEE